MTAKLRFTDIFNNEIAAGNINFGAVNIGMTVAAGVPNVSASIGTLYMDSNSGNLYRNWSGTNNWILISSATTSTIYSHHRNILINSAVTSTDTTAPSVGDLVGIFGAGTWSASGTLNSPRNNGGLAGSQNAAFIAAGASGASNYSSTELFNGSAWSASAANTTIARPNIGGCGAGSQQSGLIVGGLLAGTAMTTTDLFNGSAWTAGGNMSVGIRDSACTGVAIAAIVTGAATSVASSSATFVFNGSIWSTSNGVTIATAATRSSGGTQNATFVAGGGNATSTSQTEIFNGAAWALSSYMNVTARQGVSPSGSQNSAIISAGFNQTSLAIHTCSEIFNGSVWLIGTNMSISFFVAGGAGSQGAALIAGGAANSNAVLNTTQLYNQTIYRKLSARYYPTANRIGVLSNTNTVLLQGSTFFQGITYPANSYLILNRNLITQTANEINLSNISISSVSGAGSAWTYTLVSTTNLNSLIPGMFVVASGGTLNSSNTGTFVISTVNSQTSITVINPNGATQSNISGTLNFVSTMLAVNNILPQDIVIGKTDSNGILNIVKPIQIGSFLKRLK